MFCFPGCYRSGTSLSLRSRPLSPDLYRILCSSGASITPPLLHLPCLLPPPCSTTPPSYLLSKLPLLCSTTPGNKSWTAPPPPPPLAAPRPPHPVSLPCPLWSLPLTFWKLACTSASNHPLISIRASNSSPPLQDTAPFLLPLPRRRCGA